jgi:hypothetical protein
MPCVLDLQRTLNSSPASSDRFSKPELINLFLPSTVLRTSQSQLSEDFSVKECRLRVAQADDSLTKLRKLLRITMGLWDYKHTQLGPSQGSTTRARSMIYRFRDKINHCTDCYRSAYSALKVLDPGGDWATRLLETQSQ